MQNKMQKRLFLILLMAGVLASILVMSRHGSAATLLAYDGSDNGLYSIDTATAIATFIGTDFASNYISEIELSPDGVIYAADTDDNTLLHTIDPSTGSVTGTITMTFPVGGDVLTALEFVGSTLYAGFATEDEPSEPTILTTVDIGTGIVTTVGATGVSSPLGGLAYDVANSVMYGISAGGSSAELFTIDLSTGAATSVGLVTIDGESFGGTTALEFGPDGVLYALPNNASSITGHLLSIDPQTGAATDLGYTGAEWLNALTAGTMSQIVAIFVANPTTGFHPLTVTFTDQSLGNVTSWSWDFGDGSSSTMQNPSHTYTDPGTYTVSLTVTGPGGSETDTRANYINVGSPPKALPGISLLLLDEGSAVPVPGDWSGSADFGTVTFFVNSTSTGISTFGYNFSDFLCGGVLRNGGTTIEQDPPWPIIDNQFSVEINSDPNFEMTITGTFENDGRHASGTWEAVSYGTSCSGTWNAVR